jgi:hypothetical protein
MLRSITRPGQRQESVETAGWLMKPEPWWCVLEKRGTAFHRPHRSHRPAGGAARHPHDRAPHHHHPHRRPATESMLDPRGSIPRGIVANTIMSQLGTLRPRHSGKPNNVPAEDIAPLKMSMSFEPEKRLRVDRKPKNGRIDDPNGHDRSKPRSWGRHGR